MKIKLNYYNCTLKSFTHSYTIFQKCSVSVWQLYLYIKYILLNQICRFARVSLIVYTVLIEPHLQHRRSRFLHLQNSLNINSELIFSKKSFKFSKKIIFSHITCHYHFQISPLLPFSPLSQHVPHLLLIEGKASKRESTMSST